MRSMGVRYCIVVLCKMMWCENGELRIDVDERQAVEFCSCGGTGSTVVDGVTFTLYLHKNITFERIECKICTSHVQTRQ